jgi:hypothetical protein
VARHAQHERVAVRGVAADLGLADVLLAPQDAVAAGAVVRPQGELREPLLVHPSLRRSRLSMTAEGPVDLLLHIFCPPPSPDPGAGRSRPAAGPRPDRVGRPHPSLPCGVPVCCRRSPSPRSPRRSRPSAGPSGAGRRTRGNAGHHDPGPRVSVSSPQSIEPTAGGWYRSDRSGQRPSNRSGQAVASSAGGIPRCRPPSPSRPEWNCDPTSPYLMPAARSSCPGRQLSRPAGTDGIGRAAPGRCCDVAGDWTAGPEWVLESARAAAVRRAVLTTSRPRPDHLTAHELRGFPSPCDSAPGTTLGTTNSRPPAAPPSLGLHRRP